MCTCSNAFSLLVLTDDRLTTYIQASGPGNPPGLPEATLGSPRYPVQHFFNDAFENGVRGAGSRFRSGRLATTCHQFNPANNQACRGVQARHVSSGDHIEVDTPVPIPNTEVKHFEPMIVLQVRK